MGTARFRLRKVLHMYRDHFTCRGQSLSLGDNACAWKILVVQVGKCPGYPEGILGEGSGKGCEVSIAKGFE